MKVIIIGCTHAGTSAAKNIRQLHPDVEISIYERNNTISFLSCGIALHVGGVAPDINSLFYSSPEQLAELGIEVHMRHEVIEADVAAQTLTVRDIAADRVFTNHYDKLVVTTGSWPLLPPIEGIDLDGVFLAKSFDHANRITAAQKKAKKIAVVGAGYIGVELAEAFTEQGKEVTLVDKMPRIFARYFDAEFSSPVEQAMRDRGVNLALNQCMSRFEGEGGKLSAVITDNDRYECDMAIFCIGFRPVTDLFRGKLTMTPGGALIVDDYMRTSDPDIFAAGDCCAVRYNPANSFRYIPLATNAIRMGTLAARNLFTLTARYQGTQGTSAIKVFGRCLAATGLTDVTACEEGFDAASVTLTDNNRPEFMPTYEAVTLRLTYEKKTGRLLGGQISSEGDYTQMMNTLSIAIQNRMTISELAFTDFFFLPHFGKPWNLLNLAALKAG